MQLTVKDHTATAGARIASQGTDCAQLRGFVDSTIAQLALLGIQFMWTTDTQTALEECARKKNAMKEANTRQIAVLTELSSWCLQDLGPKVNRRKIETLVTVHVHQRDVTTEMFTLFKQKKIKDANDFEWTKQARFYWRQNATDTTSDDGSCIISITDVDFNYMYVPRLEGSGSVITPLTDRCYITLAQALGMCFGGAPAGPAGTGRPRRRRTSATRSARSSSCRTVATRCRTRTAPRSSRASASRGSGAASTSSTASACPCSRSSRSRCSRSRTPRRRTRSCSSSRVTRRT